MSTVLLLDDEKIVRAVATSVLTKAGLYSS